MSAVVWRELSRPDPVIDPALGLRRARAATLMMLALPGSAYLYQGEELGLAEVADLPPEALVDPVFTRTGGAQKGRDGCRVPIPWTATGTSLGFGANGSWLPQPAGFARCSVEAQDGVADSTLEMYRRALGLRRELLTSEPEFGWSDAPDGILVFDRGPNFRCVVNLSSSPLTLGSGHRGLVASGELVGGELPPDTAVWLGSPPDLGRRRTDGRV